MQASYESKLICRGYDHVLRLANTSRDLVERCGSLNFQILSTVSGFQESDLRKISSRCDRTKDYLDTGSGDRCLAGRTVESENVSDAERSDSDHGPITCDEPS
jgi:hypothetical protein